MTSMFKSCFEIYTQFPRELTLLVILILNILYMFTRSSLYRKEKNADHVSGVLKFLFYQIFIRHFSHFKSKLIHEHVCP